MNTTEREDLAQRVVDGQDVIRRTLKHLEPDIRALWTEFENLPAGESIKGCRTKKEFCERYLACTLRAIQQMFHRSEQCSRATDEVSCPQDVKGAKRVMVIEHQVATNACKLKMIAQRAIGKKLLESDFDEFNAHHQLDWLAAKQWHNAATISDADFDAYLRHGYSTDRTYDQVPSVAGFLRSDANKQRKQETQALARKANEGDKDAEAELKRRHPSPLLYTALTEDEAEAQSLALLLRAHGRWADVGTFGPKKFMVSLTGLTSEQVRAIDSLLMAEKVKEAA